MKTMQNNLLESNSDNKYLLITDTREIKKELQGLISDPLTESDYTAIILKAGFDTGVLCVADTKDYIHEISKNVRLSTLAAQVEPIVYETFRVLLLWTMSDNPRGAFTTFQGERLWLWWK